MRTADCTYVDGLNGVVRVRFEGKTRSGENIGVEVKPGVIINLARFLEFPCCKDKEGYFIPGHAVWHYHQNVQIPCREEDAPSKPVADAVGGIKDVLTRLRVREQKYQDGEDIELVTAYNQALNKIREILGMPVTIPAEQLV